MINTESPRLEGLEKTIAGLTAQLAELRAQIVSLENSQSSLGNIVRAQASIIGVMDEVLNADTLEEMLLRILGASGTYLGCASGIIFLSDGFGHLIPRAYYGMPVDKIKGITLTVDENSITGIAAKTKTPYICNDPLRDLHYNHTLDGVLDVRREMAVPITIGGNVEIILCLQRNEENDIPFTNEDASFISTIGKYAYLGVKVKLSSIQDNLTKLYTRDYLEAECRKVIGSRKDKPHSLLFFDMNYFKAVNDQYGHQVGDRILKIISGFIVTELRSYSDDSSRPVDIIARHGGDEFITFLPDTNLEDALEVRNRLYHAVSTKLLPEIYYVLRQAKSNGIPKIGLAIGVATLPSDIGTQDSLSYLIKSADKDMYAEKRRLKETDRIITSVFRQIYQIGMIRYFAMRRTIALACSSMTKHLL